MTGNGSWLAAWGLSCWRRPWTVLIMCCIVAAFCGYLSTSLHVETDIMNLLPQESPLVQTMLTTMRQTKSFDKLYLIISDEFAAVEERQERMQGFADAVADELNGVPHIKQIQYRRDEAQLEAGLDFFLPRLTHYMTREQCESVREKLGPEAIRQAIRRNRLMLLTQQSPEVQTVVRRDPLRFSEEMMAVLAPLISLQDFQGIDLSSGYFMSRDGAALLMIVEPTFAAQDVETSKVLVGAVHDAIARVQTTWDDETPPRIELAGGPAIAVSDESLIKRDMQWTIISSIVGVLLLFQLAFRRLISPLIVIVPLGIGIIDTLGFAAIALGRLNILSSIFAVILIGLGIDFAIHLYHRYMLERGNGLDGETAISVTFTETGRSVLAGGLTTSAAFLAITFTEFQGLRELGLVAGAGILLTMINVFCLFPVLMRISDTHHSVPKLTADHTWWPTLEHFLARYRRQIIAVAGGVTCVMIALFVTGGGVHFETDLALMRPQDSPVWTTQQKVAEQFLWQGDPLLAINKGTDLASVVQQAAELDALIEKGPFGTRVIASFSPAKLFPRPTILSENIAYLSDIDPDLVERTLTDALRQEGFRPELFRTAQDNLRSMLTAPPPVTLEGLEQAFGEDIITSLLHTDATTGEISAMTTLYLAQENATEREQTIIELSNLLEQTFPTLAVTGLQRIIPEFKRIIRHDFYAATMAACLTVLLIIALTLKRPLMIVCSLIPLTLGILWTLEIMKFAGLNLNFMNIVVTPMLIGIGIDDGIHLIHHFMHRKRLLQSHGPIGEDLPASVDHFSLLAVPGRGIVLTSLTTMIGFGSLSFAHYPGLRWIGILTVTGVGLCLFFSVIVLPAILYVLIDRRTN